VGSPPALCVGLGVTILDGHRTITELPIAELLHESYKDGDGSGGQGVCRVAEVPGFVQPRAEKVERRHHRGLQPFTGSGGQH